MQLAAPNFSAILSATQVLTTEEAFCAAIPTVVRAIESYDVTTVRASVGNFLIAKHVAEHTDVKVLFNGDGADEASGSYMYFYGAPTDAAYEVECGRLLADIHLFDVLRSDRSIAAHGLEARTPFLDRAFVATYLAVPTALRRPRLSGSAERDAGKVGHGAVSASAARMEKQLLREAFDDGSTLPAAVLWRRKEAFSDGVSTPTRSWHTVVQEHVARVTEGLPGFDDWQATAAAYVSAPGAAPRTREALYYRRLFEEAYGAAAASVIPYAWLPRWVPGGAADPSARTLAAYYDKRAPLTSPGLSAAARADAVDKPTPAPQQ